MSGLSDDEWEACARNPDDEQYLTDQERALLRLLDAERARADAAEAKLAATQPTTMLHDARCDSDLCAPECKIRQWCESRGLPYPGRNS